VIVMLTLTNSSVNVKRFQSCIYTYRNNGHISASLALFPCYDVTFITIFIILEYTQFYYRNEVMISVECYPFGVGIVHICSLTLELWFQTKSL
jgi:hypothetical protein